MKKYAVMYLQPSGMVLAFVTDDKDEAERVATSEKKRTGWPTEVYRR